MRSSVIEFDHTNTCRWTLSIFWTAGRTNEFTCLSRTVFTDKITVGYWFCTFATNSFSRRTVVQINLCPPHSVPCATRHANLPASTKPPRHRGDCAKGAKNVFSQAATGRHPLQSSCNPRRAKHIKPQRFDWCLQSNGRARAWIRPWSLPAWTVSRDRHKQFSAVPNKKLPSQERIDWKSF